MYRPFIYAFKIWGTAVLLCPIVVEFYLLTGSCSYEVLDDVLFLIAMGAFFSLPSMVLLWAAIQLFSDWPAGIYKKLVLSIVCVVLSWLPFVFFSRTFVLEMKSLIAVYAVGTVAGVWIYNLHPKNEHTNESITELEN